jgi:hypothetical protein
MTYPVFASGDVLNASDMNGVGLWLVKTQAVGTGVSSVAVTGAFSADYDSYLLTYAGGTMSADTGIKLQLGASSTAYYGTYVYGLYTGTLLNASDNNNSVFSYVGGGNSSGLSASITLHNPFLAQWTKIFASGVSWSTNMGSYTGVHASAVSYTGFTIAPLSGTFTGGTIRVYGYRN